MQSRSINEELLLQQPCQVLRINLEDSTNELILILYMHMYLEICLSIIPLHDGKKK